MNEKVKEQVLAIRDSGEVNMCFISIVQRIAFQRGFKKLANFIRENPQEYMHFILYGCGYEKEGLN